MRIKWQDEDLGEWSGKPTLKEQRRIKDELGMLPGEFLEAVGKDDPYAVSLFVALMKTRQDPANPVYLEDIDGESDDLETILSAAEKDALAAKRKEIEDAVGKDAADLILGPQSTSDSSISTEPSSDTPVNSGEATD